MDLHKLSLQFNQTIVVEDPEDGFGRYFLDIGSFITLEKKVMVIIILMPDLLILILDYILI